MIILLQNYQFSTQTTRSKIEYKLLKSNQKSMISKYTHHKLWCAVRENWHSHANAMPLCTGGNAGGKGSTVSISILLSLRVYMASAQTATWIGEFGKATQQTCCSQLDTASGGEGELGLKLEDYYKTGFLDWVGATDEILVELRKNHETVYSALNRYW